MPTTGTFLDIIRITRLFNEIKRVTVVENGELENVAEHSFQVALCSWFLANQLKMQDLNMELVIIFALAHDLPEVYANDMSSIIASKEQTATHEANQAIALERLERELNEFPSLIDAIRKYEARDSIEAELVFFVDKMLPVLNVWMSKDSYYKDHGITFASWKIKQYGRIEALREFNQFHQLLGENILHLLEQHAEELFARE